MKNQSSTPLRLTEKSKLTGRVMDYFWNCSDDEFPKFLESVPRRKLWRLAYHLRDDIGAGFEPYGGDFRLRLIEARPVWRYNALVRKAWEFEKQASLPEGGAR